MLRKDGKTARRQGVKKAVPRSRRYPVAAILARLKTACPDARCALDHENQIGRAHV